MLLLIKKLLKMWLWKWFQPTFNLAFKIFGLIITVLLLGFC
jgi:hypothetical protein